MKLETSNNNFETQDEVIKKHNTAKTSVESFTELNNSGQRLKEKYLVFEAIKNYQPVTSRMLMQLTGKERTNITRSLYDLVNEISPQIKEAFTAKCTVTNRNVKHYTLINWQREENKNEITNEAAESDR